MKPLYDQGDVLQYLYSDGSRELLVIIDLVERFPKDFRYKIHWLTDAYISYSKIKRLDDHSRVTLYARGQ